MATPVLVAGVRTPVGRHNGALRAVRPDDLAAHVLKALLARVPALDPAEVDDVILGAANQAGEDNRNVARMALLLAGLPESVPGQTVNRLCASGLQAAVSAAQAIRAGEGEVFLAGGVESMTRAPLVLSKGEEGFARGDRIAYDTTLGWRFPNPRLAALFPLETMAETAENVAERYRIPRRRQDEYALRSQQRWAAADGRGVFREEIVPVPVPRGRETVLFERDEHPRPDTTLERLAALPPITRPGGTVTAGNASGVNDGAAALLIMAEDRARAAGLTPLCRIVGAAAAGVDPRYMGMGPVAATRRLLDRLGRKVSDLALVELNEAFAAQTLACIDELGLDEERVNVNGGAIAIGHPLGMSGARLLLTLALELRRRGGGLGLATLCIGVGQGLSVLVEAVD